MKMGVETKINKEIGERLRILREGRGHTIKEFAELLHIPYGSYIRYETGERLPPANVLRQISEYCSASVDWILTGLPDKADYSEKVRLETREKILERYHYRCIICGFAIEPILRVTYADPRLQGTDDLNNLVVFCPNCQEMVHKRFIPLDAVNAIKKRIEKRDSVRGRNIRRQGSSSVMRKVRGEETQLEHGMKHLTKEKRSTSKPKGNIEEE